MSYSIRYRPDGRGWWYEIFDRAGRLIRGAWSPGSKWAAITEGEYVLARQEVN